MSWEAEVATLPLEGSRVLISGLVDDLRAAPKITKGVAKRLLKRSVESFNRLDAAHRFITTVEREDICDAFDQIMRAAKFPELSDSVEEWRDW